MSKEKDKNTFTATINGKETEVAVRLPTSEDLREAERYSASIFRKEVEAGTWLASEAEKVMRQRNIWNDDMDKRYSEIKKKLLDNEVKVTRRTANLQKGKHGKYDKNTYYGLCIEMRELRNELINLTSVRSSLEGETAEGKANNARINYLIYASTVYNNSKKRIFSSYEDFDAKSIKSTENADWFEVALQASKIFQELYFGLRTNINDILPENLWLKKYGFVDGEYHLVNEANHRINVNGQLVDEQGRPIDENGNFIDINGNPFDDTEYYLIEPKPFMDEEGEPIIDEEYKADLAEYNKKKEAWETKKKKKEEATKTDKAE